MADLIAQGAAFLNDQLKEFASTTFRYRRGLDIIDIDMIQGGPREPLLSFLGAQPGSLDLHQSSPADAVRSFQFDADDLDFGLGRSEPQEGDEVLEAIGSTVQAFRVMPPVTGTLAWDWVGPFRGEGARYIVHTQPIGAADGS